MTRPGLSPADLFRLEVPAAPAVASSGAIAYLRQRNDAIADEGGSELWRLDPDGSDHRRLVQNEFRILSFAWSPCGAKIVYVAREPLDAAGRAAAHRLMVLDVVSGDVSKLASLEYEPRMLAWAPDGQRIAFVMAVRRSSASLVRMPASPPGAHWAPRARYIDRSNYRFEGAGLVEHSDGIFLVPGLGGEVARLGTAEVRGGGVMPGCLSWMPDGASILFASDLGEDWDARGLHTDIHAIDVATGETRPLTDATQGTNSYPVPAPDGEWIACLGCEDRALFHLQPQLRLLRRDGSELRVLLDMDRDILSPAWDAAGEGLYFAYFDSGVDKLAHVDRQGRWHVVADSIGGAATPNINLFGTTYGVARDYLVTTTSTADAPSQIAVVRNGECAAITDLNQGWLSADMLGSVTEVRWASSLDGREIQGWLLRPPGFDPNRSYPLIVEIHGGPNAAYGPKFSFAFQTWAAAGYLVFYPNYRGSTSYGREFVEITQFDYPQQEHHDILSGIDAVQALGGVDAGNVFILGASAGGTLTAWTLAKSARFRAAVCMHPFINYSSFSLTWDLSASYAGRWSKRPVWEDPEWAWSHSPLSLVGQISTPTLVVVGDRDQRTPPGEGEQLYQALKLRGIPTALLIRAAVGHGIGRPSQEIETLLHIMRWFELHRR